LRSLRRVDDKAHGSTQSILRTQGGVQYTRNIQESYVAHDDCYGGYDVFDAKDDGEFGSRAEGADAETNGDAAGSHKGESFRTARSKVILIIVFRFNFVSVSFSIDADSNVGRFNWH
jgi:hypothetical protein